MFQPLLLRLPRLHKLQKQVACQYRVLAFESSCDDTCVALLERVSVDAPVTVVAELKETLNSALAGGVIPLEAVHHHQRTVARLVTQLGVCHGFGASNPPDLICATRGPGMVGSLSATLQFAKGLSVAWNRPLVGVHHMLGHLLAAGIGGGKAEKSKGLGIKVNEEMRKLGSGRAVGSDVVGKRNDCCEGSSDDDTSGSGISGTSSEPPLSLPIKAANQPLKENNFLEKPYLTPSFPFLSLLCSGGHTMLVLLTSLDRHEVLINTIDIAAGDALDKSARCLGLTGNMIGPELEALVEDINSERKDLFLKIRTDGRHDQYPLKLSKPMISPKHLKVPDVVEFSFSSFSSCIDSFTKSHEMTDDLREFTAFKIQEVLFDHIIDRINVCFLKDADVGKLAGVTDFVCSGGVAANKILREKLQKKLIASKKLRFHFPDLALCTDNAAMIGNAGMEIFEKLRLKSELGILPIRKWPMEELLDAGGWLPVNEKEYKKVTGFDL